MTGYAFMVTIKDVSTNMVLKTSQGKFPAPISPGVWVVSMGNDPLFTLGKADRGKGLEAIAEDGSPTMLGKYIARNTGIVFPLSPGVWAIHKKGVKSLFRKNKNDYGKGLEAIAEDGNPAKLGMSLKSRNDIISNGVFKMPVGDSKPGPLTPDKKYQFSFSAAPGAYLSFATMFVQSNDLFYAPNDMGIRLFDTKGMPLNGNFTSRLYLWDAGTEKNEMPGYGSNQVQRQQALNTGISTKETVKKISQVKDGFTYPATKAVIKVTIASD